MSWTAVVEVGKQLTKCRGVQTDLDLDSLADNEIADAIPHLLTDYSAECKDWTVVAGEHWKKGRWDRVDELLNAGFKCMLSLRSSARKSSSLMGGSLFRVGWSSARQYGLVQSEGHDGACSTGSSENSPQSHCRAHE